MKAFTSSAREQRWSYTTLETKVNFKKKGGKETKTVITGDFWDKIGLNHELYTLGAKSPALSWKKQCNQQSCYIRALRQERKAMEACFYSEGGAIEKGLFGW